jgi:hypothetical protein
MQPSASGSSSAASSPPREEGNWLLAALPAVASAQLAEWCETVPTPVEMVISEPGKRIEHVYFPLSGCQSIVTVADGVMQAEVGTVGWEGMSGLSLLHGVDVVPTRCFIQVAGFAKRIESADFSRLLAANAPLRVLLHRYAQFWTEQSAVSIACNGLHSVEQRCARWLLHTHDRIAGATLPLTQEFLGIMLAVRRASVSIAAESLQSRDLIKYRRGKISVLDRAGLEAASCGCYHDIQSSYRRLLPRPPVRPRKVS